MQMSSKIMRDKKKLLSVNTRKNSGNQYIYRISAVLQY